MVLQQRTIVKKCHKLKLTKEVGKQIVHYDKKATSRKLPPGQSELKNENKLIVKKYLKLRLTKEDGKQVAVFVITSRKLPPL